MKVQMCVANEFDYYKIRNVASLVTLHHGEAFIALDIANGKQITTSVNVNVTTEKSSKLNYKELEETSQIGEGSFGIQWLLKMKISREQDDNSMIEFENEVHLLDKFQCEFIINFYGAVFIKTKFCMVAEFAEYGSANKT
ncbi:protein serine/threonine kinase, putative [Entamoeba invadens IP1]|uniref:protein serine/threonine kinase, putative n=1 Tax=Entamoeba invadens IP1 TaxID=370355 RepID=UPI0002C3E8BE|nr:protein serine/threonine kinase, putative [Entamoeba invadens IP1]ELP93607.1 protein serine/threonine kinase, putative [Entamoeba invadens IP1]|eukprot:XP_004260378.1 protein serine/threonine kinase, putative [Entamoeba invadens IP1]